MSTRLAIPAGVILGLLVLLLNTDRSLVPLSDDFRSFGDIGFFAMLPMSAIMAGWAYVLGIRAWNARVATAQRRQWVWAFIPVALAYMVLLGAIIFLVITVLERAFQELALSKIQGTLLVGIGAAAFTSWMVADAMKINTSRLLTLVVVILAGGVYLTLITIDDPLWWRVSFSYLGKMESNVNYIFNTTLIFSGILLLIWRTYFLYDYDILLRHGVANARWAPLVRYGLLWIGVAVMIVGLFKSQLTPFSSLMHNTAAYSMAGVFLLFMLGGRWIAPGFPAEFHTLSLAVVAVLIGAIVWAISGGVNTVGLEMTVFVLGLMWLSQFARNTENVAAEQEPEAFAK
ncbi:MAG: hypothetical protein KDE58_17685 [Caldilineaceae bacterium]|nr:hypothetical protein [Caldilineaceae bacterium]